MVIAFANNQVIVTAQSATNTIYTDPVPLNDNDRASCHLLIEYLINAGAGGVTYLAQVSNDGTNWADTSTTDTTTAVGLRVLVGSINGAFLRFKISYQAGGSGIGACCFDLHVMLDHV